MGSESDQSKSLLATIEKCLLNPSTLQEVVQPCQKQSEPNRKPAYDKDGGDL